MNLEILGAVASLQQEYQRYVLAAGDWQSQPAAIKGTDFLYRGKLIFLAPLKATCVMKRISTIDDYFLVSRALAGRIRCPMCRRIATLLRAGLWGPPH